MSGRATLRRDGEHRITLRVTVDLHLDTTAVAIALASYKGADVLAVATRKQLLEWARDGVESFGLDHICMGDTSEYVEETQAARGRLIELGVFPEPASSQL